MTETRRTWLATLAMSGANAIKLIVQFAILPVLARFLGPGAYGVVSLAMPFILLANLLCDAGLGSALARRPDCDDELESTVFWISAGIGGVVAALVCALAWPAAIVLHQPQLAPVLLALSPILLIASSLAPANARVLRERRFAVFAIGDIASTLAAAAVALTAAISGWGYWSLVAQQLTLWTVKSSWVFTASRFRVRGMCRPSRARDLIAFGLNSVGANIADFTSRNIDNVLIGAILGVATLGRYAMAYQIIRLPDAVVSGPLYLTIFTAVARANGDREVAARVVRSNLRLTLLAITPLFAGLALTADLAVAVLLGKRWTETGPLIALLAPAGFCVCVYSFIGATLMGMGRSDRQFRLSAMNGVAVVLAVLVGAQFGVIWAALGVSLALVSLSALFFAALKAETGVSGADVAGLMRAPLVSAVTMGLAVFVLRHLTPAWPAAARLALCIAGGGIVYIAALALQLGRKGLQPLRDALRRQTEASPTPAVSRPQP